jgi:hypothetical protein
MHDAVFAYDAARSGREYCSERGAPYMTDPLALR